MQEENKNLKLKKSIIHLAIICGVFIVLSIIFYLISLNSNISEFLSKNWSRPISIAFGHITSLFNFSVFEWSMFILVLFVLIALIIVFIFIGKKEKMKAGKLAMQILATVVGIICIYTSTVTVCYNRKAVPFDNIENSLITEDLVLNTYNNYMNGFEDVANKLQKDKVNNSICPYSKEELLEEVRNEYSRLDNDYFGKYISKPKYVFFSPIMSEFNILGITFTPYGEANVNKMAPEIDIVPTIAHELAHTKGIMRESDANLIAYYLLLTSNDDYLKYCGFIATSGIMRNAMIYSNNKTNLRNIPEVAKQDILKSNSFWDHYHRFDKIGDFFNDLYLKIQGESGTDSYFEYNQGYFNEETQKYENVVYTLTQRTIFNIFRY